MPPIANMTMSAWITRRFPDFSTTSTPSMRSSPAALQSAVQRHGAAHPDALAAGLALLEHNDLRALARRIDVPALVIAGQYDRVTPPQASEALAQLLPQAQLLQIRRAGHAPFLSHSEQVGAALLDFTRHDDRQRQAAGVR